MNRGRRVKDSINTARLACLRCSGWKLTHLFSYRCPLAGAVHCTRHYNGSRAPTSLQPPVAYRRLAAIIGRNASFYWRRNAVTGGNGVLADHPRKYWTTLKSRDSYCDIRYLTTTMTTSCTQWTIKTWHFIFDYNFG